MGANADVAQILAYGDGVDDDEEDEDEGKQTEEVKIALAPGQPRPGESGQDEREEHERDDEMRRITQERVKGEEQRIGIEQNRRVGLVVRVEESREERELENDEGNRKTDYEAGKGAQGAEARLALAPGPATRAMPLRNSRAWGALRQSSQDRIALVACLLEMPAIACCIRLV